MQVKQVRNPFTSVIHSGENSDLEFGSVSFPIFQSSTFAFKNVEEGASRFAGKDGGYIYTRIGNPTVNALEESVAYLEGGYGGLATASGMAAISTTLMTFLGQKSHLIGTSAVYGPSRTLVENEFARFGVECDFIDTSKIENIERHLKPHTTLLFIETPANPTLILTDIEACAELARKKI